MILLALELDVLNPQVMQQLIDGFRPVSTHLRCPQSWKLGWRSIESRPVPSI